MNSILNPNGRSLSAKLDAYTDSDQAFKRDLIQLMIGDLRELQQAINDSKTFYPIAHKVNSTLTILDDAGLNSLVSELKYLQNSSKTGAQAKAEQLFQLIEGLVKDLEDEASFPKAS